MKFFAQKKGFTLVELLLIFSIVTVLAVASAASFFRSSDVFVYLENYKASMDSIRVAKSLAMTNKVDGDGSSSAYGVRVEEDGVTVFVDNGLAPFEFDIDDEILEADSVDLADTPYDIAVENRLTLPVDLFFEAGTGELTYYHNNGFVFNDRAVVFSFTEEDLTKYIVIYKVAGLPEAFDEEPTI